MRDRLAQIEAFTAIVDGGSFTAAAERLGLSRAAVSKQLMALEDRLAARLLNRTTRRSSLTEVGAAYYERCRQLLADLDDAEREAGRTGTRPRGLLRVNAPMTFGTMHLAPALPGLLAAWPELSVDLTLNDRTVDLIEEGFDVAVRIGQLADSSLIARRLAPCRLVCCAAPEYLRAHGEPRHPHDLAGHECLLYSYTAGRDGWEFGGAGGPRTVRVKGRLRANNGEALLAAAAAGLGIALSPTFMVSDELSAGRLVPILRDFPVPERGIHAVWAPGRHLSGKIRAFVDFLAARFAPEPYWDAWSAATR
jgi:DNA-binding transcriptional LysR family regulator